MAYSGEIIQPNGSKIRDKQSEFTARNTVSNGLVQGGLATALTPAELGII